MKKLLVLAVLLSSSVIAGERVIIKDQKLIEVEVSKKTVLCSAQGYGLEELKINIAALNGWTLLDHSNILFGDNSGLPCMTAGPCAGPLGTGFSIDDVIQGNPRKEQIVVKREVIDSRHISSSNAEDCLRTFKESLHTNVGGVDFHHTRFSNQEIMPKAACDN